MIKEMFPSYKSDALCIQGRDKCKNRPLLSNMWLRRHHFFVESQNKTTRKPLGLSTTPPDCIMLRSANEPSQIHQPFDRAEALFDIQIQPQASTAYCYSLKSHDDVVLFCMHRFHIRVITQSL